jgi:hypothetical protein
LPARIASTSDAMAQYLLSVRNSVDAPPREPMTDESDDEVVV